MSTILNPLTFEDLVNERSYYIYGNKLKNDHIWNIYSIGTYETPTPKSKDKHGNWIQEPARIVNRYYDWEFLKEALNRIINNPEINLEALSDKLNSALVIGHDSKNQRIIITGLNEWQSTKISKYLGKIRSLLNEANDDYTFASQYNYGATLFFLMLFYIIRNDHQLIQDNSVRAMVERVNTIIAELEAYYKTIVNPVPYPEIVAEAIRTRGIRDIIESYMREPPPRIVVGKINTTVAQS